MFAKVAFYILISSKSNTNEIFHCNCIQTIEVQVRFLIFDLNLLPLFTWILWKLNSNILNAPYVTWQILSKYTHTLKMHIQR